MLITGVDIGQSIDPTAIIVVERYTPTAEDAGDQPRQEFSIRYVDRVPLGTPYTDVVEHIAQVSELAESSAGRSVTTVVDATGVGKPIVDMLRRRLRMPLRAVTFTAAIDEVNPEPHTWRVPKRDLVQALEVVLQERRLHHAPGVWHLEDLRAELQAFEVNISKRGRDSYEAAGGHHDDLVMALALAIWWGSRKGQGSAFLEAWRRRSARRGLSIAEAPS